jgi:hypothetical protein
MLESLLALALSSDGDDIGRAIISERNFDYYTIRDSLIKRREISIGAVGCRAFDGGDWLWWPLARSLARARRIFHRPLKWSPMKRVRPCQEGNDRRNVWLDPA